MSEFQIVELNQGSVTTNFDDVKAELNKQLDIYRNIEVTEDSLPICKDVKKTLRGQSRDIDTFRKMVKQELSAPIKDFEDKCKELQGLIEDVISPIDEGIRTFDEQTRQEKLERAKALVEEIAGKMNYLKTEDVIIKDSWGNVSTTQKAIKEDIKEQIQHLQDAEKDRERRIETFRTLIEIENKNLDCKMSVEDFMSIIDEGREDAEIITAIKDTAELIHRAENKQKDKYSEKVLQQKSDFQNGYLVRILDNVSTADDVLSILASNGYFARLEE